MLGLTSSRPPALWRSSTSARGQHRARPDQRRSRQRFARSLDRAERIGRVERHLDGLDAGLEDRGADGERLVAASGRAGWRRGGAGALGKACSWQRTFGCGRPGLHRPAEALRRLEQAGADGLVGVGLQHGAAGELQRRGVERAERAGCDEDDLAGGDVEKVARPRRSRRRSAGPDSLAAASCGLQILKQRRGADAEQRGTDIAALRPARPRKRRRKPALSGRAGAAFSPSEWRRIDCFERMENSSPVSQVRKPEMTPSSASTHFEWVPGMQITMTARGKERQRRRQAAFPRRA